jgi:hypothetical protein
MKNNETFVEIQSQSVKPSLKYKAKKLSSKYEIRCEAFISQRNNETFIEIRSQSVKPSSK